MRVTMMTIGYPQPLAQSPCLVPVSGLLLYHLLSSQGGRSLPGPPTSVAGRGSDYPVLRVVSGVHHKKHTREILPTYQADTERTLCHGNERCAVINRLVLKTDVSFLIFSFSVNMGGVHRNKWSECILIRGKIPQCLNVAYSIDELGRS